MIRLFKFLIVLIFIILSQPLYSAPRYVKYDSERARLHHFNEALVFAIKKNWPSAEHHFAKNVRINSHLLDSKGHSSKQWNIFGEWGSGTSNKSSGIVAVLDTGIFHHFSLHERILNGADLISDLVSANDGNPRDMDASDPGDFLSRDEYCDYGGGSSVSSWHGTHVAGIISMSDEDEQMFGVSSGAYILPVRVLGSCGGTLSDLIDGILWAIGVEVSGLDTNKNIPDVINLSLGAIGECPIPLQNVINEAKKKGIAIVASSGNSGVDLNKTKNFPSSCQGVLSVGATDEDGKLAGYSNYGGENIVYAPGGSYAQGIISTISAGLTFPDGDLYSEMIGTSMAAPHVSAIILNLKEDFPELSASDIQKIILKFYSTSIVPLNYEEIKHNFNSQEKEEKGWSELLAEDTDNLINSGGSLGLQKNSAVGCGAIDSQNSFNLLLSFLINFLIYQISIYIMMFLKLPSLLTRNLHQ